MAARTLPVNCVRTHEEMKKFIHMLRGAQCDVEDLTEFLLEANASKAGRHRPWFLYRARPRHVMPRILDIAKLWDPLYEQMLRQNVQGIGLPRSDYCTLP